MRCSSFLIILAISLASGAALAQGPQYHLGRPPSQEQVKAWDVAIGPEGAELPAGSGSAKEGAKLYAQRCAKCHGPALAGSPLAPPLVGGKGTLTSSKPIKTIGSYWAFSTTIWDYINRTMPWNEEGTLSANDVYALTAFLLFKNDIIRETEVMDAKSLPKVQMPNRNGFIPLRPEYKGPSSARDGAN